MVVVCPQLLLNGACADGACGYRHDVQICRPCGAICYNATFYQTHCASQRHHKRVNGLLDTFHCSVCQTNVSTVDGWAIHVRGKKHNTLARQQGVDPDVPPEEASTLPGHVFCNVCSVGIPQQHWNSHVNSRSHGRKSLVASYEAAFEEAGKNKHGIDVSHEDDGLDFGIVDVEDALQGATMTLTVRNTVPTSRVSLVDAKFSSQSPRFSVSYDTSVPLLSCSRSINISVVLRQQYRGHYDDRLEMVFEDTSLKQRFVIIRPVKAIVGSRADYEALKPKSPYVPRKRTPRTPETDVVPGVAPPSVKAVPYVGQLPHARIPPNIAGALSRGQAVRATSYFRNSILPSQLNSETHARYYKTLLWVEEHRMENDLQMYDITDTKLTRHNQYYYLAVPGLAENRPSVLVGDIILVQPSGSAPGRWFEGHVHFVRRDEVGLCFHTSFRQQSAGDLYTVRFKLNRIPLRRQHQALDAAFHPDRLLFPTQTIIQGTRPSRSTVQPHIYNRLIAGNEAQLQAVASIASLRPGSAPFVIFGPPGTGKTITMVESIRQVLRLNPRACILVCAPSNSAADLVVSRLSILGNSQLFRFYAPFRNKDLVPDSILPFTYRTETGHFSVPPMAIVKRYRVIVSTCVSASFAHGIGMPRGHFTHVFVDEAGQATEPEVMIAIKTMADNDTNVVLSGDPKQLGPIIRSAVARDLGLEKSYIERLMARPEYDETAGYGVSVVKLVKNFRSHESILKFPNERFYRGELQACAETKVTHAYIGCTILANPDFPVLIHSISGKDDREASSPSFFNIDEASQVKAYVLALKADRRFRTSDADIGIITPYHAQCLRLRSILRPVADGIKVGSVEEFQGQVRAYLRIHAANIANASTLQERKVIIVSTVRSSREFVEYDLKHTLGFVANPRRFNVAVTRAQALLIVIGDPDVLSLDPLWRSFLNYAHGRGGWKGPPPSWDTGATVDHTGGYDQRLKGSALADMNEFTRRMEMMTLNGVTSDSADDEDIDVNVDRPWREVE
ncbi:P-loop containing nucleoside triphosphate hydrolase protein [Rhodofomes roseus]|uniref:RNA helicase n=1 Tax=Rhodofomes roseus TaxID=34475 RepID=A0ABQ8KCP0_9APHY|nr:P-loop containing nucleoside triphosphate hydrolase protein [Rhodofomes roseus]KAH9835366.1 P-loop containing nucleoside triphosphate hydrolase protein [Rhodofomes roseus]